MAETGIHVRVPGWKALDVLHVVFDLNGTLTLDGALLPGVSDRFSRLQSRVACHLVTADTFGTAESIASILDCGLVKITDGESKLAYLRELGTSNVAAIGNGANDALMLEAAALGVVVLGSEGTATSALRAADIVCASPLDAIDLLLHPDRITATLRT